MAGRTYARIKEGKFAVTTGGSKKRGSGAGNAKLDALEKLNEMPVMLQTKVATTVMHDLPGATSSEAKKLDKISEKIIASEGGPAHVAPLTKTVPLKSLHHMGQNFVTKEGVAGYIKSGSKKTVKVIEMGGKHFIWDGHHRAVAAGLMGETSIKVTVIG